MCVFNLDFGTANTLSLNQPTNLSLDFCLFASRVHMVTSADDKKLTTDLQNLRPFLTEAGGQTEGSSQ